MDKIILCYARPVKTTRLLRHESFPFLEYKEGSIIHSRKTHTHIQWSLSYLVSGETHVSIGNETVSMKASECLSIPPLIPHLCTPYETQEFQFGVLYIPTQLLTPYKSFIHQLSIGHMPITEFNTFVNQFIQAKNQQSIHALFEKLTQSFTIKTPIKKQNRLFKNTYNLVKYSSRNERYKEYYNLRNRFGTGKKTIEQIFKIEKAKSLLATNLSICEIAQECGFYDQSHFHRCFRQFTGLTPLQYKGKQ